VSDKLNRRAFIGRIAGGAITSVAVAVAASRIGNGTAGETTPVLRPPGALDEDDFLAKCIRCGRCADACPNRCITAFSEASGKAHSLKPGPGQRNTPVIFPRQQACMLCNGAPGGDLLCTSACPTGALQLTKKDPDSIQESVRMGTAEVDTTLCYSYNGASCGACVRACPFEGTALRAGLWETPIVDPDYCIGCGLCERACVHYPQAIHVIPKGSA
jgi:ferredoxin-type protein NapG